MSKMIHISNDVAKVLDHYRKVIGKRHPAFVNSRTGSVSYSVVIKRALTKGNMWSDDICKT